MRFNIQYTPGQYDDEGRPVSTEPFTVTVNLLDLEPLDKDALIHAIQESGEVQFAWRFYEQR